LGRGPVALGSTRCAHITHCCSVGLGHVSFDDLGWANSVGVLAVKQCRLLISAIWELADQSLFKLLLFLFSPSFPLLSLPPLHRLLNVEPIVVEDVNQDVERAECHDGGRGWYDGSIVAQHLVCQDLQGVNVNEDRADKPEQVRNQLKDCCNYVQVDCLHSDFAFRLFATRDINLVHSSSRTDQHK